jgi:hypothetical protein
MKFLILLFAICGSFEFVQAEPAADIGVSVVSNGKADQTPATLNCLKYNHSDLTVDLGVGLWAWPIPMDFDGDGDYDLVVSCPDTPYNGVYFFENASGNVAMPIFKPGILLGKGLTNVGSSFADGKCRILTPGKEYPEFRKSAFSKGVSRQPMEIRRF